MCLFFNTWWENAESNYSIKKRSFHVKKIEAYIVSKYHSSLIDFPGVMIDSQKESPSEVKLDSRTEGHR